MIIDAPDGWYSRGYLPHLNVQGQLQFITFRLADSLPQQVLAQMHIELAQLPEIKRERERRQKIEQWLDAGLGCCALQHPRMAEVMQQTLQKFAGERYHLLAWCIMPNHVHVLIDAVGSLPKIVQSWKSYTGRWAIAHNAELGLSVPGTQLWMREYWDRFIRDEAHFHTTVEYIHNNPIKVGLCVNGIDWLWSSASLVQNTAAFKARFWNE
jgi:REP element-mobilizing transposase RayT